MRHELPDNDSTLTGFNPERRQFLRLLTAGMVAALASAVPTAASAGRGGGPSQSRPAFTFGQRSDGRLLAWRAKVSSAKVGPGPNLFSDSEQDVWVDPSGLLHLTITKKGSRWWCTEVIAEESLGYGTYRWTVQSDLSGFAPSVVLGLFTWDDAPAQAHREIDIEFARWNWAGSPANAQYTVQPYDEPGHRLQFLQAPGTDTTHEFQWSPGNVSYVSRDSSGAVTKQWQYNGGDVPTPGQERTRMNLWLFRGSAPDSGNRVHIVLRDFTFTAG